jgi:hypothetical protein
MKAAVWPSDIQIERMRFWRLARQQDRGEKHNRQQPFNQDFHLAS